MKGEFQNDIDLKKSQNKKRVKKSDRKKVLCLKV